MMASACTCAQFDDIAAIKMYVLDLDFEFVCYVMQVEFDPYAAADGVLLT